MLACQAYIADWNCRYTLPETWKGLDHGSTNRTQGYHDLIKFNARINRIVSKFLNKRGKDQCFTRVFDRQGAK